MSAFTLAPAAVGTQPPRLPWPALVLVAGALGLAIGAWSAPTQPQAAATASAPHLAPSRDTMDALRQAAALGDLDASIALADALLDRYDAGAGTPALFEALQWLQRDLDTAPVLTSAAVQRVVHGPCRHDPLLQWHWLCNEGE